MTRTKRNWILLAAITAVAAPARFCGALDTARLGSEFSLPDRPRNLIDTQDEYFRAVEVMQDDDAAVVRARESAMKDAQSAPEYVAAEKAVDQAYQAFMEKKNAAIANLEKTNAIYSGMKSHIAPIESQIETARQNPATTQQQLQQLYDDRETFQHQCQTAESDAIDRAGVTPLRQAWIDASKKVSDLQEKQRSDVENNDRLKAAVAESAAAMKAVLGARAAISGSSAPADSAKIEQLRAADLMYRSSHASFAGNDAWLTYGWTDLAEAQANKPVGGSAPPADGKK